MPAEPGQPRDQPADVADSDFLSFAEVAVATAARRLPDVDIEAVRLVMLLHRVADVVVYDLESKVHRPAGWSWSAFRLLFTIWVAGPLESRRAAELAGMSRAAVSSLTKTLCAAGLLARSADARDGRAVILSLTEIGREALESTYRTHNRREQEWAGLLDADDLGALNALLGKLARAAHEQDWVARRD